MPDYPEYHAVAQKIGSQWMDKVIQNTARMEQSTEILVERYFASSVQPSLEKL